MFKNIYYVLAVRFTGMHRQERAEPIQYRFCDGSDCLWTVTQQTSNRDGQYIHDQCVKAGYKILEGERDPLGPRFVKVNA